MRFLMIILLASLYWISSAQAEDKRLPTFPVLGYVEGNLLYVPTYRKEHIRIPRNLFAYGGGKEFVAVLRKNNSYIALDDGPGCTDGWEGQYVYETQMTAGKIEVIIFDEKKNIQSVDKKMTEPASHTEWEIFHLTSREGGHDVLRITKNGQCEAHVDYYFWCNYDTEPSDKEDYDEAMCGEKIEDFDTGF